MVQIVSLHTARRRMVAALSVLALGATGAAFAAGAASRGSGAGEGVPEDALTAGASPLYPSAGPAPAPMQLPPIYRTFTEQFPRVPVLEGNDGPVRGVRGMAPVRIDSTGIPAPALAAYHRAADLLSALDPACGLDWALLGAIGRVESNHARFGGNAVDAAGIARPGIIGIALDGRRGTARITDTDGGRWDRDGQFDRAVGPMQFIPGTWRSAGRDADGDGAMNPQSLTDSAAAAGVYLCSGRGDLRSERDARAAVLRYNHSEDYAQTVLSIARAYRTGAVVLPMAAIPAARPAAGSGTGTPEGSGFGWGGGSSSTGSTGTEPGPAATSASPTPTAKPTTASKQERTSSPSASSSQDRVPAPALPAPRIPVPRLPLPTAKPALPTAPVPTPSPLSVDALLALPHLPPLLGDPGGLVRVLDPGSGQVVCLLDRELVDCP